MQSVEEEIQKQYTFIEKIGTGSFGHIISIRNKNNGQIYACKIEKNHGKKTILVEKEFQIMAILMPTHRFPDVFTFKKLNQNSFIIMQKLNKSIEELFNERKKMFTIQTVALISEQMFSSLQILHDCGYLHRDLKPQNIMTSLSSHTIKLIDFGLADSTMVRRASALIGNVRFSSRNSHFGYSSKKDDLESLVYVLYYFLMGTLPWQNSSKEDIQLEINRKVNFSNEDTPILKLKRQFLQKLVLPKTKNEIKLLFYEQFKELVYYIFELNPKEDPDYRYILHKCDRLLILSGTRKGKCFDWCAQICPFVEEDYWSIFQ